MNHSSLAVHRFSRPMVESGDFSHFLNHYPGETAVGSAPARHNEHVDVYGRRFRQRFARIHSIPEVRAFYAEFRESWPYWLYFCNLDSEEFHMMVLCCLPSIAALKVDQRANVAVEYDRGELLQFLQEGFGTMNAMGHVRATDLRAHRDDLRVFRSTFRGASSRITVGRKKVLPRARAEVSRSPL